VVIAQTARLPDRRRTAPDHEVLDVKPNMARLTWAVASAARYSWVILILASLALSLGAGIKWDWD
jgi:hypothetical protein